ncbi:MAG: lipid A biosynthesis lauroyl acyltransferase [Gammaproteobacteria bacterium]|uniref:Lipid A biosynthesis acyltransferase n=1 Tax=OM182 bacterium TaxID=2510334 RepID=A0A520S2R1_9GAMM|nr:lipid A biosynthesis lauroyl acyltransferase [Gammaproteobacteria bacterium]OUV68643.1 MAG: hypothetical protein CBC93_01045 [Gammaproteobacteria bacterium TMED133]RZO76721.1 MAG: LpxL/LpxP family Kdo(2)-lipid IV(A) lauroyl/palmitoleoyl acyltransferase [OM182 bacterium]
MSRVKIKSLSNSTILQLRFLHPRFWFTWVGLALIFVIIHFPHPWRLWCGSILGKMGYYFALDRKNIVDINLSICFPELSETDRKKLNKKVFRSAGLSIIETALVWLRSPITFRNLAKIEGLEHLETALKQDKGVVLVGMHFSTLDFCAAILSSYCKFDVMYRGNKNPLIEAIMNRGRVKNFSNAIERKDVRSVIKSLKQGRAVWYGPDQDYGRAHSVFVPFFGYPTATISATSRIAGINKSPVIIFTHYRLQGDSRYRICLSKPLDNFPSKDPVLDASRINGEVEKAIKKAPEQYWWLHRRFKTPPKGKNRPY